MSIRLAAMAAVSACFVALPTFAQFPINSGDARFSQVPAVYPGGALGMWDTGSGAVNPNGAGFAADLIADLPSPDSLARHGWSYRPSTASTVSQLSFGNAQSLANGAQITGAGNTRTIRINNVGNATEQANFVWTYTLVDGGPGFTTLNVSLVLENLLASQAVFRVGVYSDVDVLGTVGGDTINSLAGNVARFTEGLNYVETSGPGAVAFQYGETATIGGVGGLPGDVLNNTPGVGNSIAGASNASSAYIYSIAVPGGVGSTSTAISYSISIGVVPEPGVLGLAALGGLAALRRRRR